MISQREALMNSLCRICGQGDKKNKCISMFSESGKRQEIEKKIRHCLPLIIDEGDSLPKQICLKCLPKLDASWELVQLCNNGQLLIEKKLHCIYESDKESYRSERINDKVSSLTTIQPITRGASVIITLRPAQLPPTEVPTDTVVEMVHSSYELPVPTTSTAPPPVNENNNDVDNSVFPQGLIQVLPSNKSVLHHQRKNEVKSPPRRNVVRPINHAVPSSRSIDLTKRRERPAVRVPAPKRSLRMCKYCNKTFPDEIIDHHINLHLKHTFFTCLDCNKNFRSEMAMSRHHCVSSEPMVDDTTSIVDLDQEDDLIYL